MAVTSAGSGIVVEITWMLVLRLSAWHALENGMEVVPNLDIASEIFGKSARAYCETFERIGSDIFKEEYLFLDNEIWKPLLLEGTDSVDLSQQICWEEMLARAHMVSVAAIVRTSRWMDAAVREYSAENLFGWASASRSLMESAGDIKHSLGAVPLTLAEHHKAILDELDAKASSSRIISKEMEDTLIHFTHARKPKKEEKVPESHKAEAPWKYIKHLEDMEIEGAEDLYAELCEIVHPAASSVEYLFKPSEQSWKLSKSSEVKALHSMAKKNKDVLGGTLEAAFNPAILTLKVLQKFNLFRPVKGLRKTGLEALPYWKKMEAFLR